MKTEEISKGLARRILKSAAQLMAVSPGTSLEKAAIEYEKTFDSLMMRIPF